MKTTLMQLMVPVYGTERYIDIPIFIAQYKAYMQFTLGNSYGTIRRCYLFLNQLYIFSTSKQETPFGRFCMSNSNFIQTKHTRPISAQTVSKIIDNLPKLSICVQIAFLLLIETAGRLSDVLTIKTNSLDWDKKKESYVVKIEMSKTFEMRRKANRPTYTKHYIPNYLAEMMINYKNDTNFLREQLPMDSKNMLLVYISPNLRKNTKRPPLVLDRSHYYSQMKKIPQAINCCDNENENFAANARSIRAEVGRRMRAEGYTAAETADKLGNTSPMIDKYYNTMNYEDEASLYNFFYEEKMGNIIDIIENNDCSNVPCYPERKQLYGNCGSKLPCYNKNDCRTCSMVVNCKEI